MWRSRLIALYCVKSRMRRKSLLRQLESVKSIMRYRPQNGTAGLARSRVSGSRRVPLPPARMTANTFFMMPPKVNRDFNRQMGGKRGRGGQGGGVRSQDREFRFQVLGSGF